MVLQFEGEINACDFSENGVSGPFVPCGSSTETAMTDDSLCLNNWLNAVALTITAPGQVIYARLPPARRASGWHDICSGVTIPSAYEDTIYIFGGAKLRIPPAPSVAPQPVCTTPPNAMLTVGSVNDVPINPNLPNTVPENNLTMLYLSDLTQSERTYF